MSHSIVWFDLPVANLERATQFYGAILDLELEINSEHGFGMVVLPHKEGEVAGCLYQAYDFIPNKSDLLIYFNVEGVIKKSIEKVALHGGKVIEAVTQIGQRGYRAIILDSEGNKVALYSKELD